MPGPFQMPPFLLQRNIVFLQSQGTTTSPTLLPYMSNVMLKFEAGLTLSRGVDVMTSRILLHPKIGQIHVPGWVSEMTFHTWMG